MKPSAQRDLPARVPVVEYDHSSRTDALGHFAKLDELARLGPVVWNDFAQGFWMITDYEWIKEAYQTPDVFTSDSILASDPNPQHRWIPTMTNAPEHVKYRQLLNAMFAPAAVAANEANARAAVNRIIDRFIADGHVEVMGSFAGEVPCEIFLGVIGLPMSEARQMAAWVADIFDHLHDVDRAPMLAALGRLEAYWRDKLAARRANPDDPHWDVMKQLCDADFDGRPLTDDEILNVCNTLTMAGLDTVRAQLGHAFLHFATHPDDRQRCVDDPTLWPGAIEEMLRLYPIVSNDARKVGRDVDFHGCPMKAGDMAVMSLGPACRDPRVFVDPDAFVPEREGNRHLAFAAGPHRCLGSHFARMELLVALDEWHRLIPNYRIAPGGVGQERGSQMSLLRLELEWDAPGRRVKELAD